MGLVTSLRRVRQFDPASMNAYLICFATFISQVSFLDPDSILYVSHSICNIDTRLCILIVNVSH